MTIITCARRWLYAGLPLSDPCKPLASDDYFLASGVTDSGTRWPSRRTTTGNGWPIFTASIAQVWS